MKSARQAPLRFHSSETISQATGEEKGNQKRDTTHTHTHTHTPSPVPWVPAHTCTCTCARQTQHRGSDVQCSPAGAPGWSRARGKGGQETPHPPQRTGPSQPQGPRMPHRGVQRSRGPQGFESGPRHLGTLTHTHTHTSACLRVHTGHRRPTSWTAHHGNRMATSQLQSPPEGF